MLVYMCQSFNIRWYCLVARKFLGLTPVCLRAWYPLWEQDLNAKNNSGCKVSPKRFLRVTSLVNLLTLHCHEITISIANCLEARNWTKALMLIPNLAWNFHINNWKNFRWISKTRLLNWGRDFFQLDKSIGSSGPLPYFQNSISWFNESSRGGIDNLYRYKNHNEL